MIEVTVYSRTGCHLCEVAKSTLVSLQNELASSVPFEIHEVLIDGNPDLERQYGEEIPVTLINGSVHDFWRVDPDRFRKAIAQL